MTIATSRPSTDRSAHSQESEQMLGQLRQARSRDRRLRILCGALTPILLLVVWQLAASAGALDANFFPAPSTILRDSAKYFTEADLRHQLLTNLHHSGVRLGVGFVIGAASGMVVGLLMGLVPIARYSLSALINGTYPLPKLTLYPLMIIFFGIGNVSMIALVALGVFFMMCINTVAGVTYSPPIYRDIAQAFQVPPLTRLMRITIPAAIPSVIGGLKLAFGQALIIVVSTEFVSGQDGIGYMIWNSWQVLNVSAMFIGLAVVGITGWLGSMAIAALGRKAVPWQDD
jgi:ABC-type nitrate/sulfonate/bicarbonate transport system permease component